MPPRSFRKFALGLATAAIASLSTASSARADLIVTAQETGDSSTGPVTVATGSPSTPGGVVYNNGTPLNVNDFTFTQVSASETQTAALSEVLSSTLSITNTSSTVQTITIVLQATNFTAPLAPPGVLLLESLGGTTPVIGSGAPNAISFTSQAAATTPAPTLTPDVTGQGVAYSASANESIVTGLSGTYTVSQTYVITLNAGANLQFTGRTDLIPVATPEPATVAMALTAAPLLGLGGWLRRRRRARA
jgi:hypothetical protein